MNDQKQNAMYDDAWHRPHADHKDEDPSVTTFRGPEALKVKLDTWGPNDGRLFATIYNQAQSNWGEEPSAIEWDRQLGEKEWAVIAHIMDGKHLQNALELISFGFLVEGCTRACTHELVRTRVGASFAQHGGRDNDWRHRGWTLPETLARVIDDDDGENFSYPPCANGTEIVELFKHYLGKLTIDNYIQLEFNTGMSLGDILDFTLATQKALYAAMVDSGIPWQDARRILGIGHQTYIHANYNFIALRGVLAHRTEHGAVDWEIDCVGQLMLREVWQACPPVLARALGSHSDKAKVNKFANLYSWPPNKKWPEPKDYDPNHPTQFHREQMPFWVLDPRCFVTKHPIEWIPTNGSFPWEEYNRRYAEVEHLFNRKF